MKPAFPLCGYLFGRSILFSFYLFLFRVPVLTVFVDLFFFLFRLILRIESSVKSELMKTIEMSNDRRPYCDYRKQKLKTVFDTSHSANHHSVWKITINLITANILLKQFNRLPIYGFLLKEKNKKIWNRVYIRKPPVVRRL